jgi:hypothetical protein
MVITGEVVLTLVIFIDIAIKLYLTGKVSQLLIARKPPKIGSSSWTS